MAQLWSTRLCSNRGLVGCKADHSRFAVQLAALNAAKLAKHAPHLRLICALAQAEQADYAIKLGGAERDLLELEDGRSYH